MSEKMEETAVTDITGQRREKTFDNLLELHTRICEEGRNLRDVLDFSEALLGMLKKQGANLEYAPKVSNGVIAQTWR